MQVALQLLEAYEKAMYAGLPEMEQDINMEQSRKALNMVADYLKHNKDLRTLASDFTQVKYSQETEQEEVFEEVEHFRIVTSNRLERHDFLAQIGSKSDSKDSTPLKFPKATKSTLKFWLFSNQENPYPLSNQKAEKDYLCSVTDLTRTQLNQWFINGRRRILHSPRVKREFIPAVKPEKLDLIEAKAEVKTEQKPAPKKSKSKNTTITVPPPLLPIHYSLRQRPVKTEKAIANECAKLDKEERENKRGRKRRKKDTRRR